MIVDEKGPTLDEVDPAKTGWNAPQFTHPAGGKQELLAEFQKTRETLRQTIAKFDEGVSSAGWTLSSMLLPAMDAARNTLERVGDVVESCLSSSGGLE